jgi:hypothetical protein
MICGFLGCASAEGNQVISTLPPCSSSTSSKAEPRNGSAQHSNTPRRRSPLVVQDQRPCWPSFSELLFVEAVRGYAEALPDGQTGWLAGVREPHVARALALL